MWVKPSEFSDFEDQERTVFDRSRTGERVVGERYDEPGKESLHFDRQGNEAAGPQPPQNDIAVLLHGDSDWCWRPYRYQQDPGHIFTDEEIEALYPGRVYTPGARLPA